MNSNVDCSACTDLKKNAPEFVQNGVTKTVCASLQNDTGLNPKLTTLHTDCEDLDTATDCMIGMMEKEVDSYDLCDWKDFMKKFINNLTQILKAIICAICGLWTNIHNIWKKFDEVDCRFDILTKGISFTVGEDPTEGSYVVAGQGVSYLTRSEDDRYSVNVYMTYIGGGLGYISGSLSFYSNNFTDADGKSRSGNPAWGRTGKPQYVDEMIYEIRIKKSQYPQIRSFRNGMGQEGYDGGFHTRVIVYEAGEYADGQHGGCYQDNGDPMEEGGSRGHLVPDGWVYIQTRMTWIDELGTSDPRNVTPVGFLGMRVNLDDVC